MTHDERPLKIKIFADGANVEKMLKRYEEGVVSGFTTNPSLLATAGITNYEAFARTILSKITDCPISFEVLSDDFDEMEAQALTISSWGPNVNVKIPITNMKGEPSLDLIRRLLKKNVKLNVTAVFTERQLWGLREILTEADDVIVSIFAGRIADTGVDPEPIMRAAVEMFKVFPKVQILWASPREVFNVYQAERCGVHIITLLDSLIDKLELCGKSHEEYSLDTVRMFYYDSLKQGLTL